MKKYFLLCILLLNIFMIFANDYIDYIFELETPQYFGTFASTTVNEDNLNIRLKPTVDSIIVGKLNKGDIVSIRGYSDNKETIDGFSGYWLKIKVEKNDVIKDYASDNFGYYGWVFSKYINIDPNIEVSKLCIKHIYTDKINEINSKIDLEIDRQGKKDIVTVYPRKFINQDSYYFVWSADMGDFLFSDPVGTFKWNPRTNEITHMTDMGYDCESAWCIVSDDEKFLFQDYGTSPGVRGFAIFDLKTKKKLYSGSYLNDLEYDGKSVVIVEKCDRWNINKKRVSNESIKRSEEFKKTLQQKDLEFRSIVVRYKLNLDSFSSEYFDCTTVVEQ